MALSLLAEPEGGAAGVFGLVHGAVGVEQQGFGVGAVEGIDRHPHAAADVEVHAVDGHRFGDCGATYSRGIDVLPAGADKANSVWYYYRGICEERSKQWPKAEADMKKALEVQPDQPHVLNYLGYSWIDQGVNLDEGMKMIDRKSVV